MLVVTMPGASQFYLYSLQTELCERRREAIVKKYTKCHNDRTFCHNYFMRSIEESPISKLAWRVAKLKKELGLIFA